MSIWNKLPEDVLFGYEPELWDRYDRHIVQAFFAVNYDDIILSQREMVTTKSKK